MWITGLANTVFSGAESNGPLTSQYFDRETGAFSAISGPAGAQFTPYSQTYEVFGETMISGRVDAADGTTLGYELYRLNDSGVVHLVADIVPGEAPSFFDLDKGLGKLSNDTYVIAMTGGVLSVPTVLFATGEVVPFADFFENIDSLARARYQGSYRDTSLMIARVDGGTSGVLFEINPVNEVYRVFDTFDRPVGGHSVNNVFVVEDRLFAQITTTVYGRELWELEGEIWTLVDDHAPGFRYGSPSYAFTQGGVHYFTAVNDTYGRELFRLGEDGFELALDFAPGPSSGALPIRFFRLADDIYMRGGFDGPVFRMDANGAVAEVPGLGPEGNLPWPSAVISFDEQFVRTNLNGEDADAVYVIEDGALRVFDLPDPFARIEGFVGGTLYATVQDAENGLTLYALSSSGAWVALYYNPYSGSGVPLPLINEVFSTQMLEVSDVWLGDDSAETIETPETGGIIYARGGDDLVSGSAMGDRIFGDGGDDRIRGGGGDDLIRGSFGDDTLVGEDGQDKIIGGFGHDRIWSGRGADLSLGGSGNDMLGGGGGRDEIWGGTGADTVWGGNGADTLGGGAGRDTLSGDAGYDEIWGGSGADQAMGGIGDDTIGGGLGDDSIAGQDGNDQLWGGRDDDQLEGGLGHDVMGGGAGDDRLWGNDGHDTVWAGSGNDSLWGGSGGDSLAAGEGWDVVFGGDGNDMLSLGAGNDRGNGGAGDDRLLGAAGDDALSGGTGRDALNGGRGRDTLFGGQGDDTLTGGSGADTFVFLGSHGADVITDFAPGQDTIDIRSGAASSAELSLRQDGTDVIIAFSQTVIRVEGVNLPDLGDADFIFL